jgi:hypothetical protein
MKKILPLRKRPTLAEVRHVSRYGGYPVGRKPKPETPPVPALTPGERFRRPQALFLERCATPASS